MEPVFSSRGIGAEPYQARKEERGKEGMSEKYADLPVTSYRLP
jgi:hypothetical protein